MKAVIHFRPVTAIGAVVLCVSPSSAEQPKGPDTAAIVFYHPDHLSSTNIVTDADGAVVSETVYYPYGASRHEHRAVPDAFDLSYRFSDRELDAESGLQYFGTRFYVGAIGRFASCDKWAEHVEITGAYAYARNNPLRYIDPLGTDPQPADGDSDGNQTEKDAVAPVKDTIQRAPEIVKKTNEKMKGKVVGKGPALADPDPAKRQEAADALVGDVGSTAGEVGGETLWEEIDEHWSWAVKIPLIAGGAGLIYGLALGDTDLPVPLPGIPMGVGQGTFEISPEIDVAPISGEEEQYAPGVGLGMSYQAGPFKQSIKGTYSPEGTAGGGVGFSVKAGPVNVGASASGTLGKEGKVGVTVSISP